MGRRLDNARALYMEAIRDGDATAIDRYAGTRYTQHSTPVRDGALGFKEFFEDFKHRNPVRDIEIVRCFEDGRYVFLHVLQDLNHGQHRYVTADIFDTDDQGRLIEHWDIVAEIADDTVSGHSQVDGGTDVCELDRTEENKASVRDFVTTVLIGGDHAAVSDYTLGESVVQHASRLGDGAAAWADFLETLALRGTALVYEHIHLLVGQGNFVATLCSAREGDVPLAVIDLFRLEGARIVEHWDVVESIRPEDQWVNSGKF